MQGCLGTSEEPKLKVEVPVVVNRDVPPDLTEACARRPKRPAIFLTIEERLKWAMAWGYSGENCRDKSDAQGSFLANPPK